MGKSKWYPRKYGKGRPFVGNERLAYDILLRLISLADSESQFGVILDEINKASAPVSKEREALEIIEKLPTIKGMLEEWRKTCYEYQGDSRDKGNNQNADYWYTETCRAVDMIKFIDEYFQKRQRSCLSAALKQGGTP